MRDGVLGLGGDYYFGVVRTPPSAKPDDGAFIVFMVGVIWGFYGFLLMFVRFWCDSLLLRKPSKMKAHLLFGTADSHSLAWPWHPIL